MMWGESPMVCYVIEVELEENVKIDSWVAIAVFLWRVEREGRV
jgi:hypothetical protein